MTRNTLSLKAKKNIDSNQVDEVVKNDSEKDPRKRFLNGVAINPYQNIRLESGSEQFTARAIDLIAPIGITVDQRGPNPMVVPE